MKNEIFKLKPKTKKVKKKAKAKKKSHAKIHEEFKGQVLKDLRALPFVAFAESRETGIFLKPSGGTTVISRAGKWDIILGIKREPFVLHAEIEVKTGNAGLSPKQKDWRDIMEPMGVLFYVFSKKSYKKDMQYFIDCIHDIQTTSHRY